METQEKNNKKKGFWSLSKPKPVKVSFGWQLVFIPLIIVGAFSIGYFAVDVYDTICYDILASKYTTVNMGGGYELRRYYGEPDRIVRKGKICSVDKGIDWAKGDQWDSLWVVCKQNRCAYFNTRTGKYTSPFKYQKAWLFSEGVAAVVDEHNQLKFIDPHGNLAIDSTFRFSQELESRKIEFHNGLCQMADTSGRYGIIDMSGKWVIEPKYDNISCDMRYWVLNRNDSLMVLDSIGQMFIGMNRGHEFKIMENGFIEVWHKSYPGMLYDTLGNLVARQSYYDIQPLTYYEDNEEKNTEMFVYSTDFEHKGLLAPDGRVLTKAHYSDIEAITKTRFRGELYVYTEDGLEQHSVLLNERGEIVAEK